jgi:hypothetical protein
MIYFVYTALSNVLFHVIPKLRRAQFDCELARPNGGDFMGVRLIGVHLIGVPLMDVHPIGVYSTGLHFINVYFIGLSGIGPYNSCCTCLAS